MDFESFWKMYRNDMGQRLRENTLRSKDYIVELKILPYFGKRKIAEIGCLILFIAYCLEMNLFMQ